MILYQLWFPLLLLESCLLPGLVQGILHLKVGKRGIKTISPPTEPAKFEKWLETNQLSCSYGDIDFAFAEPYELRRFPDVFYNDYANPTQLISIRSILADLDEKELDKPLRRIKTIVQARLHSFAGSNSYGRSAQAAGKSSIYSPYGASSHGLAALQMTRPEAPPEKLSSSPNLSSSLPDSFQHRSAPISIFRSAQHIPQYGNDAYHNQAQESSEEDVEASDSVEKKDQGIDGTPEEEEDTGFFNFKD